jgi:hypothetical protein
VGVVTRRLVLCADDYALAPGVCDGILALAGAGRLTAVSCMTASPLWPAQATALRPLAGRVDLGLHVTLTDQAPLGPMPRTAPAGRLPPLGRLAARSLAGRLAQGEIAAEIDRQVAAFRDALGRPPDFLDGHQHAHVLPRIRAAVLAAARAIGPQVWVRDCFEAPGTVVARGVAVRKALVIAGLSAGLGGRAAALGVPVTAGFGGVLDYARGSSLRAAMPRFLERLGPRPLVMCHPGTPDATLAAADPLVGPRADELAYLGSDAFAADLARAGVTLARYAEVATPPPAQAA